MSDLPAGASIPCTFEAGQPLTAAELNDLQLKLLSLILNHAHSGNASSSQQGVQLGSEAIEDDAILGAHIKENAIRRSHIQSGAVGSSQIDDKQISAGHLQPDAITTAAIRNGNVTMEKLSAEVTDLLHAPAQGATTYCYCTYFSGTLSFPVPSGSDKPWYSFMIDKENKLTMEHNIDLELIRDDGGKQKIRSVLEAKEVKQLLPIRTNLSAKLPSSLTRNVVQPAASFKMEMTADTASEPAALQTFQQTLQPLTNIMTSPVLDERNRIAIQIQPALAGIVSDSDDRDIVLLNPGSGSNATFSDKNEPIVLQPGVLPSQEMQQSIAQLLYNYDIDPKIVQAADPFNNGLVQIIDFINNPQLLPIGYMTGASRNVATVTRMRDESADKRGWVRIKFITPYASTSSYAVSVTPEMKTNDRTPLIPMVLRRNAAYVDIAFVKLDGDYSDTANFSLTIQGELVTS